MAEHQYIVDGERLAVQDVWWGDGSRDEMCNTPTTAMPDAGGTPVFLHIRNHGVNSWRFGELTVESR
jgi:hypothetical protein